jgi:hypothetical protein
MAATADNSERRRSAANRWGKFGVPDGAQLASLGTETDAGERKTPRRKRCEGLDEGRDWERNTGEPFH